MRHKARDRTSLRARSATTATLQVAPFLGGGGEPAVQQSAVGGFPPESWEMGPELGPRLQAPITEGLVSGPWPRAALPGKKSRRTNEQNVPFRTPLGTRQKEFQVLSGRAIWTTRCGLSWPLAARSLDDATVTDSQADRHTARQPAGCCSDVALYVGAAQ